MTAKFPLRPIALLCCAMLLCCTAAQAQAPQPTDRLKAALDSTDAYLFVIPNRALAYFKQINDMLGERDTRARLSADSLQQLQMLIEFRSGTCYTMMGHLDSAITHYDQSMAIARHRADTAFIIKIINNKSVGFMNFGQHEKALSAYFEGLSLSEKTNYNQGIISFCNNISIFYQQAQFKNFEQSMIYRRRALKLALETNDERAIANSYANLSSLYNDLKTYDSAYHYVKLAIPLYEKLKDFRALSSTLNALANLYEKDSLLEQALPLRLRSIELAQHSGFKQLYAGTSNSLAETYIRMAQKNGEPQRNRYLELAIQSANNAMNIGTELGSLEHQQTASLMLANALYLQGNHKGAYNNILTSMRIKDSLYNKEALEGTLRVENRYMAERNQLLQKDKETTEKLMKNRETTLYIVIIGSVVLIALLVMVYQRMRMVSKQRDVIAQQKDLISEQKEEVEAQRDLARKQREEIMSSISYAKRLQNAVLPDLPPNLPMFVLYLPRDIVSGDFYWCSQHGDTIMLAVADCTGHGVPGACMSMLGLSYMREFSLARFDYSTAQMLDTMRQMIINSLGQTGASGEQRDGMDLTVCKLNTRSGELQFASAYNPLLVVPRQGEPYTIKGDRQPISYHSNIKPFTNQTVQLQPGDSFYMMSDGLKDLFNPDNQKFSYKRIVSTLSEMRSAPMSAQLDRLQTDAERWRGSNKQTDDITLMGFRYLS